MFGRLLLLLVSFRERLQVCDAVVEVSDVFLDKESEMLHFCGVIVEEGSLPSQGAEAFQSAAGDS